MKTQHTQGPWQVINTQGVGLHVKTSNFDLIATMANGDDFFAKNPQNEANARLIAAAPELLKVAEDFALLADLHDWEGAAIDNARAIVAKAKGE